MTIFNAELEGKRPRDVHKELSPCCPHLKTGGGTASQQLQHETQQHDRPNTENISTKHTPRLQTDLPHGNALPSGGRNENIDIQSRIDPFSSTTGQATSGDSSSSVSNVDYNEVNNEVIIPITCLI